MSVSGMCARCGISRWSLDRDHIVPRHKGGTNDTDNIQYLCQNCHFDKTHLEDMVGFVHTEEHTEKMRATLRTPEMRARLSRVHKGKHPMTPERIKALAEFLRGRPKSPEHRRHLSEAKRGSLSNWPRDPATGRLLARRAQ